MKDSLVLDAVHSPLVESYLVYTGHSHPVGKMVELDPFLVTETLPGSPSFLGNLGLGSPGVQVGYKEAVGWSYQLVHLVPLGLEVTVCY